MSACTSISFLKSPPQADGLFSHLSLLPLPTPLNSLYPSRQKITPLSLCLRRAHCRPSLTVFSINAAAKTSSGGGDSSSGGNGGYNAGGGGGNEGNDDEKRRRNRAEAFMALAKAGRTLDSLPKYLQAAIEDGGIPAYVVQMFFDTEKSISGLVGRSKEKLFADDLFLAQYAMKPGVGVFTKIAAEYERRRDNFFNELEIVFADEVMAVVADCFKLDYLLNPTVSPRTPVALNAEPIYNFFKRVAFPGSSFSLLQTIGPIVRNGAKMFAVGIIPSLVGTVVGTVVTNAFMNAGKAVDGCAVLTSAACDVSMAASFNLRYKLFAGAVKQRILKPLLHQHNLLLSAICNIVTSIFKLLRSLQEPLFLQRQYAFSSGKQKTKVRVPSHSLNPSGASAGITPQKTSHILAPPRPCHTSTSLSVYTLKATPLSRSPVHAPSRPLPIAVYNSAAATKTQINPKFSGGGGGDNNDGNDDEDRRMNRVGAFVVLEKAGRTLESLPKRLQAAIEDGKIPASSVLRYLDTEKLVGGLKERLLEDDLFLVQFAMKRGHGVFTKTAAEYECRRGNFFNELEIVLADVVIAAVGDYLRLDYLPTSSISPQNSLSLNAEQIYNFFKNCPDNAFQLALSGSSISLWQMIGHIIHNGAKLFAVGITSSLVGSAFGTVVTNAFMNAGKALDGCAVDVVENIPRLSKNVACDVSMEASFNLRYKLLAGAVKQRILKPLLNQHKLLLSAIW